MRMARKRPVASCAAQRSPDTSGTSTGIPRADPLDVTIGKRDLVHQTAHGQNRIAEMIARGSRA